MNNIRVALLPLVALACLLPWRTAAGVCLTPPEIQAKIATLTVHFTSEIDLVNKLLAACGITQAVSKLPDATDQVFQAATSANDVWESFKFETAADGAKQAAILKQVQDLADLGDLIIVVRKPDPNAAAAHVAFIVARTGGGSGQVDWKSMQILVDGNSEQPSNPGAAPATSNLPPKAAPLTNTFGDSPDVTKIQFFRFAK